MLSTIDCRDSSVSSSEASAVETLEPAAEWILLFTNLLAERGQITNFLEILGPTGKVDPQNGMFKVLKDRHLSKSPTNYEQVQ